MMASTKDTIRLAAVGDIHCTKSSHGNFQPLFAQISAEADVLLMCGDLVDYGLPEEAQVLANELSVAKIPKVAVLGNHDYECGRAYEGKQILCDAGVQILDGDAYEVDGIG